MTNGNNPYSFMSNANNNITPVENFLMQSGAIQPNYQQSQMLGLNPNQSLVQGFTPIAASPVLPQMAQVNPVDASMYRGGTQPGMFDSMTGKDWLGAGLGVAQLGLGAWAQNQEMDLAQDKLDLARQDFAFQRQQYDDRINAGKESVARSQARTQGNA